MSKRPLIGVCDDCGINFDLTGAPEDLELQGLPCQACFGQEDGRDILVKPLEPPELYGVVQTGMGISPVRRCLGHLRVRYGDPVDNDGRCFPPIPQASDSGRS